MGQAIFAPGIRIIDDPHRVRGLRSKPFDGEGVANARRALIDDDTPTPAHARFTRGRLMRVLGGGLGLWAAAMAVLEIYARDRVFDHITAMGERLRDGLTAAAAAAGHRISYTGPVTMPTLLFEDDPELKIRVSCDRQARTITVSDNGKGFDARQVRGMGLLGMEERITYLDGTFQVQSAPGQGATLKILHEQISDLMPQLSAEFTKQYPNVTFQLQADSFANATSSLPRLLSQDDGPDISRAAQLIGLGRGKTRPDNGDLHRLLLKQRHAQSLFQYRL